jgi:hypothetical protein
VAVTVKQERPVTRMEKVLFVQHDACHLDGTILSPKKDQWILLDKRNI